MTKAQYQKILDNFRHYYNLKMTPALHILERKRRRMVALLLASVLLLLLLTYLLVIAAIPALTMFALIPVTIYGVFIFYKIQYFKAEFKPVVVQLILDFLDEVMERGNSNRLQEVEQRVQSYNIRIKELERQVSRAKQKLYYRIEQRLDSIAQNLESGVERSAIQVLKERIALLEVELEELKTKITRAKESPDNNSLQRIAEMDEERAKIEEKLLKTKASLEEGLEEQIEQAMKEIALLRQRETILQRRIGERLKVTLQYTFDKKIELKDFLKSGIFNINPAVYEGEDYVRGNIGSAAFEMSELRVQRFAAARVAMEDVFRGIFFKANFYYDESEDLVVFIPKNDRQALSETIKGITSRGGRRIVTNNASFDEIFVAYASANADAANLLSQETIEDILTYQQQTNKKIYVSFIGGYIYLAITETEDILEPKFFKSNASFRLIREFLEDLLLIVSIVEDFDLNH